MQEGSIVIPWEDIVAYPDCFYDTWKHLLSCRLASPTDLGVVELSQLAVYFVENSVKNPFTFFDRARVDSSLLCAKRVENATPPPFEAPENVNDTPPPSDKAPEETNDPPPALDEAPQDNGSSGPGPQEEAVPRPVSIAATTEPTETLATAPLINPTLPPPDAAARALASLVTLLPGSNIGSAEWLATLTALMANGGMSIQPSAMPPTAVTAPREGMEATVAAPVSALIAAPVVVPWPSGITTWRDACGRRRSLCRKGPVGDFSCRGSW